MAKANHDLVEVETVALELVNNGQEVRRSKYWKVMNMKEKDGFYETVLLNIHSRTRVNGKNLQESHYD